MDIRIENGDIQILNYSYPDMISGFDEIIQRIKILLNVTRGSFAYDRTLGHKPNSINADSANGKSTAESVINEALMDTEVYVKVNDIFTDNGVTKLNITVSDGYREQTTEVEYNG